MSISTFRARPGFETHKLRFMSRQLLSGLIGAAVLYGQSLQVPTSTTDGKTPGSFSMFMDSPEGKAPVALQWEMSVPPVVAIAASDVKTSQAAESVGKAVTCAAGANTTAGGARYTCILAGGKGPITNGPIVLVSYRVQGDVHGAPIRVAIENIMGVYADLKSVKIDDTAAIIKVQ